MINLLLGAPGGGKSYESVVYHVLPALKKGRKVITNLPLNLEIFRAINEDYIDLIEIRTETLQNKETEIQDSNDLDSLLSQMMGKTVKRSFNTYPFSHVSDYGDKWRHPDTGAGPLYVIDECHICLPYSGTDLEVEHWYSLHRHESADVILITQSYSKINKAIRDLVQIVYQVRKNTAVGSQSSYTRKVRDGIRGEVVNTNVRRYDKKYFKYYQSHTRGGGSELSADDIVPIWKHWTFKASACFFAVFAYMVYSGYFKMPFLVNDSNNEPIVQNSVNNEFQEPHQVAQNKNKNKIILANQETIQPDEPDELKHPFDGLGIHIIGAVSSKKKGILYLVGLSQNGQMIQQFSQFDLVAAGYKFTAISTCAAKLSYKEVYSTFLRCDSPQTSGGMDSTLGS